MRLFGPARFLPAEVEAWQIETWAWLLRHFGQDGAFAETPLVLPTRDFFPPIAETGHARADAIFRQVQALMGMQDWPIILTPHDQRNVRVNDAAFTQADNLAAGTYFHDGENGHVSYDPALLDRPIELVSTFAHELCHAILSTAADPAPGVAENPAIEELVTDLAVAFFGFGLFGANSAFAHEVDSTSQRVGRMGYFSEDGWVFALAVFIRLLDQDTAEAKRHLKPHLAKRLDKALALIDRDADLLRPLRQDVAQGRPGSP